MRVLSIEVGKQKELSNRVKAIKKNIKSGEIKILSKPRRNSQKKKEWTQKQMGGLIYLGHIPHGFYEDEMRAYFNQFGKVLVAVVARSKKTGKSKGYGFIKFADEDVAKIAAETMNNYLMFNRIIKCRYIPPEEKKRKIFIENNKFNLNKRKINRKMDAERKNTAISNLSSTEYRRKAENKMIEFKKFFEERNIDFNFTMVDSNSTESKFKQKPEDQFGILEIDESDNEIQFKTPPQVKKVFKKSVNSPDVSSLAKSVSVKKSKIKEQERAEGKKKQIKVLNKKTESVKKLKPTVSKVAKVKLSQRTDEGEKVKSKGIGEKFGVNDKSKKKLTLTTSLKPRKRQGAKAKSLEKGVAAILETNNKNANQGSKAISLGRSRKKKSV